ncbi:MAG: hypothetical protein ACK56F_26260, partial [bacterium]
MVPGSGMLLYNGKWVEPNNSIRALAMGFSHDHLLVPAITAAERHRLLGSCIDGNISKWLVDALTSSSPSPSALYSDGPNPPELWSVFLDSGSSAHMWGDLSE